MESNQVFSWLTCLEVDLSHTDFFVSLHSFSHIGLALVARNKYFLRAWGWKMRWMLWEVLHYPLEVEHGTWKWHPGIRDSFWKPSFSGSMLNLGSELLHRISWKHPNLDVRFFPEPGHVFTDQEATTDGRKDDGLQLHSLKAFWWGLVCPLLQIFHSKTARNHWKTFEKGGVFKLQFFQLQKAEKKLYAKPHLTKGAGKKIMWVFPKMVGFPPKSSIKK